MSLAQLITIPDAYTCRGITFLGTGQQFSGGVPAGEYDVGEECDLQFSDLGRLRTNRAVPIVNIATADKWYVGVQIASWLLDVHASPMSCHPA